MSVRPAAEVQAVLDRGSGRLSDLLVIADRGRTGKCQWRLVTFTHLSPVELDAVAWFIANEIMAARVGAAGKFTTWREAALGTAPLDEAAKVKLMPFVTPVFGTRQAPKSKTHLRGYVSEWLWYQLTRERHEDHRTVRYLEPPKFQVSEGGGDGLVVYDVGGPQLTFRLWEIKKHDAATSTATDVVRGAAQQLRLHGARYLAQLTKPLADAGFAALAVELSDLWIDSDPRAGAGVSVATSRRPVPASPFGSMSSNLPELDGPGQLEGLLSAVTRYGHLAAAVREYVWMPF